ncbi:hypothetical protein Smic_51600 [Streptomyces microflavus]|uniref:Uncharacterized protein n=1 Tax=Streptomyces microflavus TaxID=1919 RepID=A0A7J0CXH6_STRMI|nr:hypothetical protein Smic_51600 [Streptomyces microflavus]
MKDGQATGRSALEGAVDAGGATVEVEVFPVQPEEFALAEPGAQGEFVQCVEPVATGCVEELPGLACGEGFEAPGRGAGS